MMRSGSNAQVEPAVPPAEEAIMAREQAEALHGEIARLPEAFRLPVVLCYLEGLTVHEAARQLRWSHGTVRSRMARAREKLRRGLTRRGIVLPAAALAAVLDSRPASASVSSSLCEIDDPGRDPLRGRTGRRRCPFGLDDGPGPGGVEIHADPQAETRRPDRPLPRRRRHQRGISDPLAGDEG